jgi:hypothetical protein
VNRGDKSQSAQEGKERDDMKKKGTNGKEKERKGKHINKLNKTKTNSVFMGLLTYINMI